MKLTIDLDQVEKPLRLILGVEYTFIGSSPIVFSTSKDQAILYSKVLGNGTEECFFVPIVKIRDDQIWLWFDGEVSKVTLYENEFVLANHLPDVTPSYIEETYPLFRKLMEYYFRFVGVDWEPSGFIHSMEKYAHIDETFGEFKEKIYAEVLPYLPDDILASKDILAKYIIDFYASRGTEESIKFLLYVITGQEPLLVRGRDCVLIASDKVQGRLSDSSIVLQDNYFHQLFSYALYLKGISFSKYKTALEKLVNPDGYLPFGVSVEDKKNLSFSAPVVPVERSPNEVLSIDFVNNRFYQKDLLQVIDTTIPGPMTFSRNSPATYFDRNGILQTAAANVLRFDNDPITGKALGARLEASATNLLKNSKLAGAVSGTPGTAPTGWSAGSAGGTLVATDLGQYQRLQTTVESARQSISQNAVPVAANKTYFYSVPVEVLSGAFGINQLLDVRNLPVGAAFSYVMDGTPVANPNAPLNIGKHVVACLVTTAATAGAVTVQIGIGASGPTTGSVVFDTPQFEEGNFRSSPILTDASASAQRLADNLSFARAGTPEGTVIVEARTAPGKVSSGSQGLFYWEDGTVNNRIIVARLPAGAMFMQMNVDGSTPKVTVLDTANLPDNTDFKAAMSWELGRFSLSVNGAPARVSTSYTGPLPLINSIRIGTSGLWGGTVARLRLTPHATDPSELPGLLS